MNVLIIGFSSIVRRKVLPALLSLPEVERIHLASTKSHGIEEIPLEKRGTRYGGYGQAVAECQPCLAYVSLPNSLHAEWATRTLEAGFHTIVDKPAVTDAADATALVNLANAKGLCMAEATVWPYHPIADAVRRVVADHGGAPRVALAVFSSPRLDPSAIQYNPALGGGVLMDRGPYAVSCGRIIFGRAPAEVVCGQVSFDGKVITSCAVTLRYDNGSILLSFLSLDSEYQNSLAVIGEKYRLSVDRIFTPPADYTGSIAVTSSGMAAAVPVSAGNTFVNFIRVVISAIEDGSYGKFASAVVRDAAVLQELKTSLLSNASTRGVPPPEPQFPGKERE
jgi:dTDP-3,4-didehydro-2,6-dideoxy-alpha-D-glucose 3-reductase